MKKPPCYSNSACACHWKAKWTFSIKFHLVSFVHCPSVPLQEGEGSGNRGRPSGCLTEAFGWVVTLPLWRPPLLSFPPSQTKWVKSTHLEGEAGEFCGGELWDRPVVVSGHGDVCQTVAGFELTECVCVEERGCCSIWEAQMLQSLTASSAIIKRHKYLHF